MRISRASSNAIVLGLAATAFVACSGSGGGAAVGDTTPPIVLSTSPAQGATGVALGGAVTVSFSEPMRASSLDATTFLLSDGASAIAGAVAGAGTTATFTPSTALAAGKTYTATITAGATDAAGNALAAAHSWSFTTVPAPSGVRILYLRYDIVSKNEDGSGPVTLSSLGGQNWFKFKGVSPAGAVVYALGFIGVTQLVSVRLDGTGTVRMVAYTAGEGFKGFSSSGRVVYESSGDLFAIDVDGTGTTTLASSPDDDVSAVMAPNGRIVYLQSVAATGDQFLRSVKDDGTGNILLDGTPGPKLIYKVTAAGQVFYGRDAGASVNVINTDGSGSATVAASPGYIQDFAGQAPDGTVVVEYCPLPFCDSTLLTVGAGPKIDLGSGHMYGITSNNRVIVSQGPIGSSDIMAIPTSGGGPVALAADPAQYESYRAICPDDRVVYGKPTGAGSYGLFSVRPDGSGTATLANSAVITFLGVTTTGRVVYETGSFPLFTLNSVNSDGSDERTLNVSANGMNYLGLSSSGKVLYLDFSPGGLESDLYIVGHDGGAPINLTGNPSITPTAFLTSVP